MFNELKSKLKKLEKSLQQLSSKAEIGATLATAQMKKRVFDEGLRADLKPIGNYKQGKRQGRKVNLVDTGALKSAIKVEPTKKGAKIVANGQGEKMNFIDKRYGKVFALSKDEAKIVFEALKKE